MEKTYYVFSRQTDPTDRKYFVMLAFMNASLLATQQLNKCFVFGYIELA